MKLFRFDGLSVRHIRKLYACTRLSPSWYGVLGSGRTKGRRVPLGHVCVTGL